jgi:phenylacetate-CoA ligase
MNDYFSYHVKNNIFTDNILKSLNRLNNIDSNQLLSLYNDSFLSLFKFVFKYSVFYKNLYLKYGISNSNIKDISDINKLPIIHKSDVRSNVHTINNGVKLFKSIAYTSGTSGSPLNIYRSLKNILTEQAYLRNYRSRFNFHLGNPLLSIRGSLDKNSVYRFNRRSNILYISSHNINSNTIDFYLGLIKSFSPVAVEAFPSILYKFCIELKNKGHQYTIPISFTSSENLYDFQRDFIESFLNTKIHDWYGNGERTICLAQDKQNKYYPLPLYSINEFYPTHIISTSLINNGFPLIRYQLDDIVKLNTSNFLKNIVSPDIHSIQGRVGVNIDLKDGSCVACIDHAFKGILFLEMAQVHQYAIDVPLEIKLVVSSGFDNYQLKILKSKFSSMVGKDTEFFTTFSKLEDLTFSISHKFCLVIKHSL